MGRHFVSESLEVIMNRVLSTLIVVTALAVMSGCTPTPAGDGTSTAGGAATQEPAKNEPAAAPAAAPAAEQKAEAPAEAANPEAAKTEPAAEEKQDEAAEDPDDEAVGGDDSSVDREKLAKAYEEVYCAQKNNEMSKILDIYKKYGFETPEDFVSMWMDATRDTAWVSKLAHDVASKCK